MTELFLVVSLILQIQGGKPVGSATGFFYGDDRGTLFFVTNKHVVSDDAKNIKPEFLRIKLHNNPSDLLQNVELDIPLYEKGKAKWHIHKDYNTKKMDIAVIELDQTIPSKGFLIKALRAQNFFPKDLVMSEGVDVLVVGFPRGFSDSTHNLAIIRNAMIASAYGVNFQGSPLFLIDGNFHPGMSGSPVMTKKKADWSDKQGNSNMFMGSPMFFLGVFSSSLSLQIPKKGEEPLGLGYVWYGYLIEEIIQDMRTKNGK